jgi:hypothetical protein
VARHKDTNWNLAEGTPSLNGHGTTHTWDAIHTALLMDIRDELKELNTTLRVLRCRNFLQIPARLERIARQTKKAQRGTKKR